MKKRAYTLDVVNNTLTITADFADALNDPTSAESKLIRQFKHDYPKLIIKRKTHDRPTCYRNSDGSKTSYQKNKNLTYERMEQFMGALPNGAEYLTAYRELRGKAEAMCVAPYAAVSAWFMEQFPKFRKNPLFYVKEENSPKIIDFSTVLAKAKETPSVNEAEGQVKKDA